MINKIIKMSETICLIISGIIMFTTMAGVFLEKFNYDYNGWFNTNGVYLIIAAIGILAIPFAIFIIADAIDK